jgi:hypothetical protein
MNESTSSTTPRPVAPWVAPAVEELGKLSDLTLDGLSCDPEADPSTCFPA